MAKFPSNLSFLKKPTSSGALFLIIIIVIGCFLDFELPTISKIHQLVLSIIGGIIAVIFIESVENPKTFNQVKKGRYVLLILATLAYLIVFFILNTSLYIAILWHIGVGLVVTFLTHLASKVFHKSTQE